MAIGRPKGFADTEIGKLLMIYEERHENACRLDEDQWSKSTDLRAALNRSAAARWILIHRIKALQAVNIRSKVIQARMQEKLTRLSEERVRLNSENRQLAEIAIETQERLNALARRYGVEQEEMSE